MDWSRCDLICLQFGKHPLPDAYSTIKRGTRSLSHRHRDEAIGKGPAYRVSGTEYRESRSLHSLRSVGMTKYGRRTTYDERRIKAIGERCKYRVPCIEKDQRRSKKIFWICRSTAPPYFEKMKIIERNRVENVSILIRAQVHKRISYCNSKEGYEKADIQRKDRRSDISDKR